MLRRPQPSCDNDAISNYFYVLCRRFIQAWNPLQPSAEGGLLIVASYSRSLRVRGIIDDLKSVTVWQQLRKQSTTESFIASFGRLLIYDFPCALLDILQNSFVVTTLVGASGAPLIPKCCVTSGNPMHAAYQASHHSLTCNVELSLNTNMPLV